jgi:FlaA1/EpsC-like NDP-sugar epimerase
MIRYWPDNTIMTTGEAGFFGTPLVEQLKMRSDGVEIFLVRSDEYDLPEMSDIK